MKAIQYRPAAQRALERMPRNIALRISGKISAFATDPASQANNVKMLSDGITLRLRVGDWRVLMQNGEILDVVEIGSRGSIYD